MPGGCSPVAVMSMAPPMAFACQHPAAVLEKHRSCWADAADAKDAKGEIPQLQECMAPPAAFACQHPAAHRFCWADAADAEDAKVGASPYVATESASKGAISQLQEYVQEATRFCMPPSCPVLHWDYDTRMCGVSLEFRATVAFLLDGVPHHSAGVWRPSKKLAQRDAAERALSLYASRWGDVAAAVAAAAAALAGPAADEEEVVDVVGDRRRERCSSPGPALGGRGPAGDVEALRDLCGRLSPQTPEFSHRWDCDGRCQSFVQVKLLGVSHTFSGQPCESPEAADADVARRVLWYLRCPGLQDAFELDHAHVRAAAQAIPEPSGSWAKDDRPSGRANGEERELAERELAERKTAIMRVQNRLQQAFARRLEAGESVWRWTYERGGSRGRSPPLFRATAAVPLVGRSFVGDWARGQREAQIQTCSLISSFLDAELPREPRAAR